MNTSTTMRAVGIGGHRATARPAGPVFDADGMDNARLGVVYLFSKIEPVPNLVSVAVDGLLSIGSQGSSALGKGMIDAGKEVAKASGGAIEKVSWKESTGTGHKGALGSTEAFRRWAVDILQKIVTEIRIKFKEPKFYVAQLKGVVMAFTRIFAKEAAPFVKGAFDIVKGLAKATPLIIDRLRMWAKGKDVEFVSGHPAIVVDALKTAMTISIFEGLYSVIKGAVDMSLTAITAGASVLAKVVIAFVETAVKIVWRLFELFRMEQFCGWCRTAWAQRDNSNAPHRNPAAFAKVYKKYAIQVPAIAALTLGSGICGDKMRFIGLYSSDGSVISQKTFDSGVSIIDKHLKPYSGVLLRNMGFGIIIADKMVKNLIDKAKEEPVNPTIGGRTFTGRGGKIVKWGLDVLQY